MPIPKKIMEVLDNRNIPDKKLEKIELEPMGDDDINYYYPSARTLTYPELQKYKTIETLLPNDKSYIFLLFLQTANSGHWTLLSRHNNRIEFFCSYGSKPQQILNWTTDINAELGQSVPYLQQLFNDTKMRVVYNPYDYQSKKNTDISTCGRHDCFRLYTILKYDMDLNTFHTMMTDLKKKSGLTYDEIVSMYLPKL